MNAKNGLLNLGLFLLLTMSLLLLAAVPASASLVEDFDWHLYDSGQWFGAPHSGGAALGDLDNDGDLDLVEAVMGWPGESKANIIYFNNGHGIFIDSGQRLGAYKTTDVALGDLDSDGDLDLVTAEEHTADHVYLNDGGGQFQQTTQELSGSDSNFIDLGDVDNDGDLDIAVARMSNQPNLVFFNDGRANFTDSGQAIGHEDSRSLFLDDLNHDGYLDMAVGNNGPNRVYFNDGTGVFIASGQSLGSANLQQIGLGDLNADGHLDMGEGVFSDDNANHVYLNNGQGYFQDSGQALGNARTRSMRLVDIDSDGALDFIAGNRLVQSKIYLNDGSGTLQDSAKDFGTVWLSDMAFGDIDQDGDLDMVEVTHDDCGSSGLNSVYLNNLSPALSNSRPQFPAGLAWERIDADSVKLTWNQAVDLETPASGLSYNLRVGKSRGVYDVMSGLAPSEPGWIGAAASKLLTNLDPGIYYWAVQTVDGGLQKSTWSPDASFIVGPSLEADAGGPYAANEGSSVDLDASGSSNLELLKFLKWDCTNDGVWDIVSWNPSGDVCTYEEDGVYTAKVRIWDIYGRPSSDTATVSIANVAPQVEAGEDLTAVQESDVQFAGSFSDPGKADTHTIKWDFGDGSKIWGSLSPTHVYADPGQYTVTLTVTDDDGGRGSDSLLVMVSGNAPMLSNLHVDPPEIMEGESFMISGSMLAATPHSKLTLFVDWGDGHTLVEEYSPEAVAFAVSHTCWDDNKTENDTYDVFLKLSDEEGHYSTGSAVIKVHNAAPTVEVGPDRTAVAGLSIAFAADISDPGKLDTHTVTWEFGDGSPPASGLNTTHRYAEPGEYKVVVAVEDDDGGSGQDSFEVIVKEVLYLPFLLTGGPS